MSSRRYTFFGHTAGNMTSRRRHFFASSPMLKMSWVNAAFASLSLEKTTASSLPSLPRLGKRFVITSKTGEIKLNATRTIVSCSRLTLLCQPRYTRRLVLPCKID